MRTMCADRSLKYAESAPEPQQRFPIAKKNLLAARLKLAQWRELAQNVCAFSPDVVILMARRLPRMYQLLPTVLDFGNAVVISDFSIMFLNQSMRGKRIAVVDDSVNVGTSLHSVCERLGLLDATIKTFAIACKQRNLAAPSAPDTLAAVTQEIIDHTQFVLDDKQQNTVWEAKRYQKISKKIAKAISLLNRPYEIEFPVFCITPPEGYAYQEMGTQLSSVFPPMLVHRLGLWENLYAGLERLSVDRENTAKWRIYIDEGKKEIAFVPMLSHEAWQENKDFLPDVWRDADALFAAHDAAVRDAFKDESRFRLQQFMTALHWGCSELPQLLRNLNLGSAHLAQDDVRMLFGQPFAEKICQQCDLLLQGEKFPSFRATPVQQSPQISSLWDAMQENDRIKTHFTRVTEQCADKNSAGFFIHFFLALDEAANSGLLDASCYLPQREEVKQKPYLRLRAGVTLDDLHRFMSMYWNCDNNDALHQRVSALLDQQIDQGFVVPVIGVGGQRVFRKGEPSPYDRYLIFAMQSMGISVSEDDGHSEILKKLHAAPQKKDVQQIMACFDKQVLLQE